MHPDPQNLRHLVLESEQSGRKFDLTNIGYGVPHWIDTVTFYNHPYDYYYFLAGLVNVTASRRIVEIGTHYGGTAKSMLRGIRPELTADIVTIDLTDMVKELHEIPGLTKLTGDANSQSIIEQVCEHFAGQPIDLLYIDADHRYAPTMANFCMYALLLQPRYIVLDDITLVPEMAVMWDRICSLFPGRAVNAAQISPGIRTGHDLRLSEDTTETERMEPGFGIVAYRDEQPR